MTRPMKIGWIGTGVMGAPMAGHLARAGHDVTAYNRTPAKAEAWAAEHGGRTAATPAAAADGADVVLTCVGNDDDLAAVTLGASGWQVFRRVTLPNVRWALLTGVLLCNARAMGEFGAVAVVSGHIRGQTNTVPLHVEILYNEYDFVGAFAVAALLALLAFVTLGAKALLEWLSARSPSSMRANA